MDIAHIKEFRVLAKVCNYGKAAQELYISQSTLFNHIKALEEELGLSLFDRDGKNIVLSEYGKLFLPYAEAIVGALNQFDNEARKKRLNKNRKFRIGSQYPIFDTVRKFRSECLDSVVFTLDAESVEEALYKNGCELAVIRNLEDPEGKYESIPFVEDRMVVVLYASHPLAQRTSIELRELKDEEFVMISPFYGRECREVQMCMEAGFVPNVVMTALNGSEVTKMVREKFGISILLEKTFQPNDLQDIVLVKLVPEVKCHVSLCWRKDVKLSESARRFVEYIKEKNGSLQSEIKD